jgi:hypothetical protein
MANDSSGHRLLSMMTTAMTRKGDTLNMAAAKPYCKLVRLFCFGRGDADCNMAAVG